MPDLVPTHRVPVKEPYLHVTMHYPFSPLQGIDMHHPSLHNSTPSKNPRAASSSWEHDQDCRAVQSARPPNQAVAVPALTR